VRSEERVEAGGKRSSRATEGQKKRIRVITLAKKINKRTKHEKESDVSRIRGCVRGGGHRDK